MNAQTILLLERAVQLEEQGAPVVGVSLVPDAKVTVVKRKRTEPCVHRIAADQFCKVCDS